MYICIYIYIYIYMYSRPTPLSASEKAAERRHELGIPLTGVVSRDTLIMGHSSHECTVAWFSRGTIAENVHRIIHGQSYTSQGKGRQGIGSFCKQSLYFSTMPCRQVPPYLCTSDTGSGTSAHAQDMRI